MRKQSIRVYHGDSRSSLWPMQTSSVSDGGCTRCRRSASSRKCRGWCNSLHRRTDRSSLCRPGLCHCSPLSRSGRLKQQHHWSCGSYMGKPDEHNDHHTVWFVLLEHTQSCFLMELMFSPYQSQANLQVPMTLQTLTYTVCMRRAQNFVAVRQQHCYCNTMPPIGGVGGDQNQS